MGNECSQMCNSLTHSDQFKKDDVVLSLTDQTKQGKVIADKISKSRIEGQFPTTPPHIQQRIEKLSKYHKNLSTLSTEDINKNQRKIYKCKSPFNFVYMNLEDRPEQFPIGKCIVYKLKQRDEFAGYFEGTLKENFVISPEDSIIVFSNGCYFQGLSDKQGRYLNQNTGLKYEGGWENQMPENYGKEKNNKGSYEGQYEKGQKHGKGRFVWNDGSFYEGYFEKGLLSGKGILKDEKQHYSYDGEFKNGEKHGKGIETTTKQKYTGDFLYGSRSGKGKLQVYKQGNPQDICKVFNGQFYSNQPHGKGQMTIWQNGNIQSKVTGVWTKGKLISVLSIE